MKIKRQFENFEKLLNDYFPSQRLQTHGVSSVSFCASKINLSTNYFGDLIKKNTRTAQEYGYQ